MTAVSLLLLSPIRFEYMISTHRLGYFDALARIAMGEAACLAGLLASTRVGYLLSNPHRPAISRGKLNAA
jgi:hypothetical protein